MPEPENRVVVSRRLWDSEAEHFDQEPDHGLADPAVRRAWVDLLARVLPSTRETLLDIGCGTGSLSLIAAELGHNVTAIDVSPTMLQLAEAKARAAQQDVTFEVMDAANPQLAAGTYEVIMCRHVLWSLPEPAEVVKRWTRLLKPGGRLVLIEGYWHTDVGLHAEQVLGALPSFLTAVRVENLSGNSQLWGGKVTDERYLVVAFNHKPE